MASHPRLFARSLQIHKDVKQLSAENFIIVLLDVFSNDECLREGLQYLSNSHYFRAMNINNCLDLIIQDEAKDALIILIISHRFVDFVRHNLLEIVPQLSHIYLFDDISYNRQFRSDRRFRGTFDNVHLLCEKIRLDIEEIRRPSRVSEGVQYILEEDAKFFWYRFFFNVLDRLRHTNAAKREMIARVRTVYKENPYELKTIDRFEHDYQPDQVIWWYTLGSFFYLWLNHALRHNDINEIFSWRVYIHDLDELLRQLQLEQLVPKQRCLFRGQLLHIDDVNRLRENTGKLITMNSFFSTTVNRDVAMVFANHGNENYSPLKSVLSKIFVDSRSTKVICPEIKDLSYYREEEECLFSLRPMFRIEQVKFVDDLWVIDLTAVDEDDQEFCTAINPWKAVISEQSFFSGRDEPLFTRYLNTENGPFLAFQLLIDVMLRLDQTEYAWEEMIEMCRLKYADSPTDMKKIDEFELTYSHINAIKWYTDDSFLYRLLNISLRMEDIDTIFKLRYYIYDLHNQLAQLHIAYIRSLPAHEPILTLYRGQRMKIIDLDKLRENVGKLISMNSFLSTTNDVEAAAFFSGDGSLDNPETEVSVLYQITIDTRVPHSIPFAKIEYESIYKDENEVLFSMASVFRIDEVELYGNLWVVDLTLINEDDENWNILTAHLD